MQDQDVKALELRRNNLGGYFHQVFDVAWWAPCDILKKHEGVCIDCPANRPT